MSMSYFEFEADHSTRAVLYNKSASNRPSFYDHQWSQDSQSHHANAFAAKDEAADEGFEGFPDRKCV